MKITILTLFPNLFEPFLATSIIGRAQKAKLVEFEVINIRDFGLGKHQVVDDKPFGGGVGMVLKPDVLAKAWEFVAHKKNGKKPHTILMSASGHTYKQAKAQKLSQLQNLIIICGHYEGIDQRFIDKYVDEEISIGDYVLTGGEIPALVVIDSVVRLIPGVLKKEEAVEIESFSSSSGGLLEYPQYTRPEDFEGENVPQVLLSGNHQAVESWRKEQSMKKTKKVRPDLLAKE